MCPVARAVSVVAAEDDIDDFDLMKDAFEEARVSNAVYHVRDGEELMDFLRRRNAYGTGALPWPLLIFLDLNMPRKDGREVLKEIKSDTVLCVIPIVVLTTSSAEEDILKSYNLGVNSFIRKPVTFEGLVDVIKVVTRYWFHLVELPPRE